FLYFCFWVEDDGGELSGVRSDWGGGAACFFRFCRRTWEIDGTDGRIYRGNAPHGDRCRDGGGEMQKQGSSASLHDFRYCPVLYPGHCLVLQVDGCIGFGCYGAVRPSLYSRRSGENAGC